MLPILRIGALAFSLGALFPTSPLRAQAARADSIALTTAVARFHDALTAGDSVRAVAMLATDALVLESGAIETRAEYLGHHLGSISATIWVRTWRRAKTPRALEPLSRFG
jgi:hypothetical protein